MGTEVWLRSYEIPGVPGTGAESDPFDASRADLFDALMRDFFDNPADPVDPKYYIHLGPGSFMTNGARVTVTGTSIEKGWKMSNGWIIAGAGMDLTTLGLNEFTNPDVVDGNGTHGTRTVVNGASSDPLNNLVVRDLTIDANWPYLTYRPPEGDCRVMSVTMYSRGNATVENVRSINTYGDKRSGNECFSIFLSHDVAFDETVPLNPPGLSPTDPQPRVTLAIRNCIAENGHGDYVEGMTAFSRHMVDMRNNVCRDLPNGFPPGIYEGDWAGGANPSAAYQFTGRGITFTGNRSYNCPAPLYFDTGNIYDVLIADNQFFGCGWGGLLTVPTANFFALDVRKNGSVLDGQYVDLPIKPSGGSDSYRVRVWFHLSGSSVPAPSNPGTLIPVTYIGGPTPDTPNQIDAKIVTALTTSPGTPLLANVRQEFLGVIGKPSGTGAWAGTNGTLVSDSTALYAQRGYEFQNWVIDNNLFCIEYGYWTVGHPIPQRYGVFLQGTGAPTCRDYTVTNNYIQFYGPVTGSQNYSFFTYDIGGHLSMVGNRTNYEDDSIGFGMASISQLSGSTQYFFGNRINSGPSFGAPIPGLEDSDSGNKPSVGTLGTITQAGALLVNSTPATADVEQASPATWWSGQGWASTPASTQSVSFRAYVMPAEGEDNSSGFWILESSINAGSFANALTYSNNGTLNAPAFIGDGSGLTNLGVGHISGLGAGVATALGQPVVGTGSIVLNGGNSNLNIVSTATVQTAGSGPLSVWANSLTSGSTLYLASTSLTTGRMVDVVVTGTGSGTGYGMVISNTRNGVSSANVALQLTASGGGSSNIALNVTAGSTALQALSATNGTFTGGISIGGGGTAIAVSKTFTAAMSVSISATSIGTVTVTATGVLAGDTFAIEIAQQPAGIVLAGVRSGTNQILVDFYNTTAGSLTLTGTIKLRSFEA